MRPRASFLRPPTSVPALLFAAASASLAFGQEEQPELPPFERILPRGQIAAVDEPVYVSAEEADIPGRAWVLGAVVDGQAYAFSLNLLNAHEVVNDSTGATPFAAVW